MNSPVATEGKAMVSIGLQVTIKGSGKKAKAIVPIEVTVKDGKVTDFGDPDLQDIARYVGEECNSYSRPRLSEVQRAYLNG